MMDLSALKAPIPRDRVKWRAQTLNKEGNKALALAYIDARTLMERLDEACGPAGWRDSYVETPRGRVICTLSLLIDGEWVSKSDGAGETDIEGDKGGMSDAFKRAGVKWGVARELYEIGNVWCPCESAEYNGKKTWRKWTADPWQHVRNAPSRPAVNPEAEAKLAAAVQEKVALIGTCADLAELRAMFEALPPKIKAHGAVIAAKDKRKAVLSDPLKGEIFG